MTTWLEDDERKANLRLTLIPKIPIMVDPDAKKLLQEFLLHDLAGTGIGYSDFIRKAVEMWRGMIHDLPTLAESHHCEICNDSGFSGYGTGYDAVCSDCGGQSAYQGIGG